MTMEAPISEQRSPRANIAPFCEKDVSEIAGFVAVQSGRSREAVEAHLRWFLLENPARRHHDPLGFGLRFGDQLAGCILCVPQDFRYGSERISLMGSSSFYVDNIHRGHGGRIFLRYSRLASQRPLFGTSANAEAAALWKAAGGEPIPYSNEELFGVLLWPPVVEEFIHRRYSNRVLSGLAGGSISNLAKLFRPLKIDNGECDALRLLTSAEQVNDLPIHNPAAKLTAMRDLPYIRWRYFSGRDATVSAFAFRSRRPDQEVLVIVNQRSRGYRGQIKTLNVLDIYPEVPPEECLRIVAGLIGRYRKIVDAVVLRSQDTDRQTLFCGRGFRRRVFEAPTGWLLDKTRVLSTRDWYPVPADGDALI